MKTRRARFMYSPQLEDGGYPPECPFSSKRAGMTRRTALSLDLLGTGECSEAVPDAATREELLQFHRAEYLDALKAAGEGRLEASGLAMGLGTADCPVFAGMYDHAALACGATLAGAELLLAGEADVAFNPAGGFHHAHPARAAGFCYLNDVVLACIKLAAGGRRVLFLDVDVHHCDGVQEAFYDRPEVMTVSFHQDGLTLFPGTGFVRETGAGAGRGRTVNVPLPAGTYDDIYLRAFREIVPPLFDAFQPEFIVLELGVDGLAGDPLADLRLTNNAYAEVVEAAVGFGRPLLATGGGGYRPEAAARSWTLCWSIMCDMAPAEDLSLGLGGVMLEGTDWQGALRDRPADVPEVRRRELEPQVLAVVENVKAGVFPLHGIAMERTTT